jgi:molecular chaperone DnaK
MGLRIQRPYDSREAYLEGDAWTVSRTDVLLVDVAELPEGTAVGFEIVLATGEVVVRGEGRAAGTIGASAGRPGGLRMRFQKLDSESKSMLRRALEVQKRSAVARPEEMKSAPDASDASMENREDAAPRDPKDAGRLVAVAPVAAVPTRDRVSTVSPVSPEPSGVRHRALGPVVAPENRDTLLARLRERAPQIAISMGVTKRRTAAE